MTQPNTLIEYINCQSDISHQPFAIKAVQVHLTDNNITTYITWIRQMLTLWVISLVRSTQIVGYNDMGATYIPHCVTVRLQCKTPSHQSWILWVAWLYSVSQKNPPPPRLSEFFLFFHKRLRIFNRSFTHLLCVPMYARLQIFMQLSPTLTKLCHKHNYLVHIICTKCPKRAKTRAFRRLHRSLISLLIVVCGKSL